MADLALGDGFFATGDRFLWHAESRTAVLSDVHLGIEGALRRSGIAMPETNMAGIRKGWEALKGRLAGGGRVIIAGDLFDAPEPSRESVEAARGLVEELPSSVAVTLLCGNHDPSPEGLRELFRETRVTVERGALVGDCGVIHGHQWSDAEACGKNWRGMIVGHQHPAVVLRDRVQSAKMICFAVGLVAVGGRGGREVRLTILPTFSRVPLGSNLLTQGHWILDCPRPAPGKVQIAGIVEGKGGSQVLNFGMLEGLL